MVPVLMYILQLTVFLSLNYGGYGGPAQTMLINDKNKFWYQRDLPNEILYEMDIDTVRLYDRCHQM